MASIDARKARRVSTQGGFEERRGSVGRRPSRTPERIVTAMTARVTKWSAMTSALALVLGIGSPAVLSGASGSPAAAFKSHCFSRPTYRQLTTAPAPGQCVNEHGQVFQYHSGAAKRSLLLDITNTGGGIWNTAIDVRLPKSATSTHLSEGDIVEVWGTVSGTTTSRTRFAGSVHVPVVDARYVTVLQPIASSVTTPGFT
jgi:hypothetical protein